MEQTTNTVLLVMDMQAALLSTLHDAASLVNNVKKAIATARKNNIPVFYIVVGFRQGTPEISKNNKGFSASKERFANANMVEFMQVDPRLGRVEEEVVISKRRISAFAGSDLEVLLRSHEIKHMVLTGIATSGVVLSTLREAADKDYRLTVLADCCADSDEEVHRVLTTKIFPRQADVISVDEWV